jgi:hypothetical protein
VPCRRVRRSPDTLADRLHGRRSGSDVLSTPLARLFVGLISLFVPGFSSVPSSVGVPVLATPRTSGSDRRFPPRICTQRLGKHSGSEGEIARLAGEDLGRDIVGSSLPRGSAPVCKVARTHRVALGRAAARFVRGSPPCSRLKDGFRQGLRARHPAKGCRTKLWAMANHRKTARALCWPRRGLRDPR